MGRVPYGDALALQMEICALKRRGLRDDVLLLLEHPPTITLGRNGQWRHLLVPVSVLAEKGVERWEVDRGGDITYHGPGQLVGYPILALEGEERDVHRFMRGMEETLLLTLRAFGVEAGRRERLTGVWTARGKIGAMGVHISRWITRHGFALNVTTDLALFGLIIPCGIADAGVTSMREFLGKDLDLRVVADTLAGYFGGVFRRQVAWCDEDELRSAMDSAKQEPIAGTKAALAGGEEAYEEVH